MDTVVKNGIDANIENNYLMDSRNTVFEGANHLRHTIAFLNITTS